MRLSAASWWVTTYARLAASLEYAGFHIHKHHVLVHLPTQLRRHGPFRQAWCMAQEGLLKLLKQLTNMGNYKAAPHHCVTLFAARRISALRKLNATSHELVTSASGMHDRAAMLRAACHSSLLRAVLNQGADSALAAAQFISSFKHGTMTISLNSWLLVSCATHGRAVMRVNEIARMWIGTHPYLRMWCTDARKVTAEHQKGPHFSIPLSVPSLCMLIRNELVSICPLRCYTHNDVIVCRYQL